MRRFEDKVALIKGLGINRGGAMAEKLAQERAKVLANSLLYDFLNPEYYDESIFS